MQLEKDSPLRRKEPLRTMERRGFLKTAGAAAGLATFLGSDGLNGVEAAVETIAGLTPQQAASEEALWVEVKQSFTIHRGLIHLDNGYTCPTPSVHTVSGGIRTFNLPHQVEIVYDLYDEQTLARDVNAFNVELSPASTTLYYTGKEKLIDTLK